MTWQEVFYLSGTVFFVGLVIFLLAVWLAIFSLKRKVESFLSNYGSKLMSVNPISLLGNAGLIWTVLRFFIRRR